MITPAPHNSRASHKQPDQSAVRVHRRPRGSFSAGLSTRSSLPLTPFTDYTQAAPDRPPDPSTALPSPLSQIMISDQRCSRDATQGVGEPLAADYLQSKRDCNETQTYRQTDRFLDFC